MTVPGYRISLGDNENILDSDSVVMVAHSHECTENRYIIPFKRMNSVGCEFCLNFENQRFKKKK